MLYPWNTIKEVIERTEYDRVLSEFSLLEQQEGFVERRFILTDKTKGYLDFLGKLSVGISVGVFTLMFNFLLFTWVLHMEASPQSGETFKKASENPLITTDHAVAQQSKLGVFEYRDKENSKKTDRTLENVAQYSKQAATWVSNRLETGTTGVMKGVHLVADKLLESVGWGTQGNEEIGKNIKTAGAIAPDGRFITAKEEIKKEVDGFQQQNDTSGTVYTVQVGAFKDYRRADALKTRLIKKGYDAYMSFTGSESRVSIFKLCKVWIGEFTHREQAERISTEIGEAEGLQAFVTPIKE